MLVNITRIVAAPIMSLQTGLPLAFVGQPIIDPHDLRIVAFYVHGPRLDQDPSVLFTHDIRELGALGVIVDSSDNLMSPIGLVRLEKVLNYQFALNGLKVFDTDKHRLGVVNGCAFDSDNFAVQQIFVRPTITRRLSLMHLTINRSQIVEIDNQKIIVETPREPVAAPAPTSPSALPFENPFRAAPSPPPAD